jgi:hypothetical protein
MYVIRKELDVKKKKKKQGIAILSRARNPLDAMFSELITENSCRFSELVNFFVPKTLS